MKNNMGNLDEKELKLFLRLEWYIKNNKILNPKHIMYAEAIINWLTNKDKEAELSLECPSEEITVSPELIRICKENDDINKAFESYDALKEELTSLFKVKYRANVINPGHKVTLIEIKRENGKEVGAYVVYMYHFSQDTFLNPVEEYECIGAYLEKGEKGYEVKKIISRAHWVPYSIDANLVEKENGEFLITSPPDAIFKGMLFAAMGHAIVPVVA
ncbi:MAG: hypothetical protein QXL16_00595, partial [Candidatus Micrarchaeaceae archaeon]